MKGVTITRHGPPSVLEVREYPDPVPGKGQIRIDVAASGLNFAEVSARQGLYPDMPKTPCVMGYEVGGVVEAVGEGVTGLAVGDRVVALTRFGGHASKVAVDQELALKMPAKMTMSDAAAIPVNYLTAHHMLFHVGTVHPGSTLVIHMAAGGVGTAVLQLVKGIADLTIIGTASAQKHDYLRKLGCTHPIDYRHQDYAEEIRKITHGRGADIILDPLGGPHWRKSWDLLAPAGRMVAFGFSSVVSGSKMNVLRVAGQVIQTPLFSPMGAMDKNRSMQGVNMGHLWSESRVMRRQLERVVALYDEGIVQPHIHARVPFSEAARAHEMIEGRQNVGKIVLVPDDKTGVE